jgi:hypothetical protein
MKTDSDWDFWKKGFVEKLSRWGMSPNAFVDAMTVCVGARAIYETKLKRYLKEGWDPDRAKDMALRDAAISYNETQQSSESAFTSAMQLDRTLASTALTVYRNSAMGYERRFLQSLSNLKRRMKSGYREDSIDFMAKKMERDGMEEAQARKVAERAYNRGLYEDLANTAIFGFVMQFAWNMGSYMPYMILGDDDKKKREYLEDAAMHALAGGVEGLSAGNAISDNINNFRKGESSFGKSLHFIPMISDIESTRNHFSSNQVRGMNDLVNILMQSAIGVNPQTVTDWAVAAADACNGDFGLAKECGLFMLRFLSIPQSQLDEIYLDELGMDALEASKLDADKLAKRWARSKVNRDAPLTGWRYSQVDREEAEDKYLKRFDKMRKERILQSGAPEVVSIIDEYKDGDYKEDDKMNKSLNRLKKDNPKEYMEAMKEYSRTPGFRRYHIYKKMNDAINKLIKAGQMERAYDMRAKLAQRLQEINDSINTE